MMPACCWCGRAIGWTRFIRRLFTCEPCAIADAKAKRGLA